MQPMPELTTVRISWIYRVCVPPVCLFLRLMCRWEVRGRENVPPAGPLLVVANHITNLDPPLLALSLGRYAVFMAKQELFRSRLGAYFMPRLGTFPVDRARVSRRLLHLAEEVLAAGHVLVIFPEGQRNRDGRLRRALPGAAMVAARTGVPILPAAITGTEAFRLRRPLARPRVVVTFGKPFHLPAGSTRADRAAQTACIMENIARLLPPAYRGVYGGDSPV